MISAAVKFNRSTKSFDVAIVDIDHVCGPSKDTYLFDSRHQAIGLLIANPHFGPDSMRRRIALLNALFHDIGSNARCFVNIDGATLKVQLNHDYTV